MSASDSKLGTPKPGNTKHSHSLFKSGFIIAIFTFASRVLGLFRELFVADLFGTTNLADSVNVAFKLPNLFRRIFAEGALSSVFVPMYTERINKDAEEAKQFSSKIFGAILSLIILIVIIFELFMPNLMFIFAPGFHEDAEKFKITVLLCRITMPYLLFISTAALMGGMLNSVSKFASFAATPIIMNIGIILITLILQPSYDNEIAISIAIVLAGFFQVIFMYLSLRKAGLKLNISDFKFKEVKEFFAKMFPASATYGVAQVNLFISQAIASFIQGGISILSYAERLYQFPLSILGIAFGTVLLPTLSRHFKNNEKEAAFKTSAQATKFAIFLSLPVAAGLAALAHPIIHIIYERGAFTATDTTKVAMVLQVYCIGLPAYILNKIIMPCFYANGEMKAPFRISIATYGINTLLNVILMQFFGILGIALGVSLAAWADVYLLIRFATKLGYYPKEWPGIFKFIIKSIIATIIMSVFVIGISFLFSQFYYYQNNITQALYLSFVILLGAIIYFICSLLFNIVSIKELMRSLVK